MFTNIDYDFSADKSLSDYGLEESTEFTFKSIDFDGNVLRLVASEHVGGELLINTDAGGDGIDLQLKVKNSTGNATSGGNSLISDTYVKTSTTGSGAVVIFVEHGETFEFTGYSLIAE